MNLATSFRKNVAAASLMAGSVLMANAGVTPAAAKEPIASSCLKAGSELAQIKCSIGVSKKATAAHNAVANAADARAAAADVHIAKANKEMAAAQRETATAKKASEAALTRGACMDSLTQAILEAKKAGPLTPEQKSAFSMRYDGCNKG